MRAVRGAHTTPELLVRRLVHSLGYRYRLHSRNLPGCPDMLFPSLKKVIFVHGCFWHGHSCRAGLNRPRSNTTYWEAKLNRNMLRDRRNRARLRTLGWSVLVLWECELKRTERLTRKVTAFLL
jgi:DNA mismatch endonuclease (patch repair protein)